MKTDTILNIVGTVLVGTGTLMRTYVHNKRNVKLLGKVINKVVETKVK